RLHVSRAAPYTHILLPTPSTRKALPPRARTIIGLAQCSLFRVLPAECGETLPAMRAGVLQSRCRFLGGCFRGRMFGGRFADLSGRGLRLGDFTHGLAWCSIPVLQDSCAEDKT